ncbi:MAG: helix-turn-helix transcriptional regulator [Nitrososphaera sp.]|nr:helix-turn-helix transcriptional regulator [Nitrososphaera sp.]
MLEDRKGMDAAHRNITELRVQRALKNLENNYRDPDLNLSSVAKSLGISPSYLSRIVARHTGTAFRQHLAAVRMRHAAQLLQNSMLSIKEISWAVGYGCLSTFERHFRSHHGKAPMEFKCGSQ